MVEDAANLGLCAQCSVHTIACNRYFETNIPFEYWNLSMPKSVEKLDGFAGPTKLVQVYLELVADLKQTYIDGTSLCLAGTHGIGKSTVCANVLKKATQKNFTALYTTLGDIVSALTLPSSQEKFAARKELIEVDFLVVDEIDYRFIASDNAADLFGRTFESILRTRLSNKLPNLLVSNSPNPTEMFQGALKQSLESLMSKIPLIPLVGKDFRKTQGEQS